MAIELKRRLALKDDIAFDTDGTGATAPVTLADSTTSTSPKINAEHIPLLVATRALLNNNVSVDAALAWLSTQIGSVPDASITAKGIIELATSTEVIAGTSAVLAVTPATLKSLTATTDRKGLVELATTAEVETSTATDIAATPAGVKAVVDAATPSTANKVERRMITSNATDTDHDITIAPGYLYDSTDTVGIELTTAITKQIDATFSPGNNTGGAATSLVADKWYYVFILKHKTSGVVDACFDDNIAGTNISADYYFRRVGSVLTDADANILPFNQIGEYFLFKAMQSDHLSVSYSEFGAEYTVSTPLGLKVYAILQIGVIAGRSLTFYTPGDLSYAIADYSNGTANVFSDSGYDPWEPATIMTDVNSKIGIIINTSITSNQNNKISTLGWQDLEL